MIRVEHSVRISRSPEEVFGRLTDVERVPEWQSSAVEMRAAGSLAQGSRIFEKRRLMGRELDNELEVVAFDPPRRLTLRSLGGPVKLTIDHELAAVDGGTRLTVVGEREGGLADEARRADDRPHGRGGAPGRLRTAEGAPRRILTAKGFMERR